MFMFTFMLSDGEINMNVSFDKIVIQTAHAFHHTVIYYG